MCEIQPLNPSQMMTVSECRQIKSLHPNERVATDWWLRAICSSEMPYGIDEHGSMSQLTVGVACSVDSDHS
jgi:hypothetical protein